MLSLSVACVAVLALSACATAPPMLPDAAPSDSTIWGDEYEGLAVDGGETVRALPRGFNLEYVEGKTQSMRADAFAHGAAVHARSYPSGEVGSVSWRSDHIIREVVAGDFTPAIAEGALIGDPRTGGDLRPSFTTRMSGLAMRSSTSTWSSMRGGGIVLGADAYRVSLGGWETRKDHRASVASVQKQMRSGTIGVATGTSEDRRIAASVYGAHKTESTFAGGEIALSYERVRAVARMVSGHTSLITIAGAGPATEEPLVFARKERWGGALERRDGWGWGASRTGVSTLTRRDVVSEVRRRRAFWDGEWRVTSDARLQLAARITREENTRASKGALASLPTHEVLDDWRARATVRVHGVIANSWPVDNAYRLEWVQNRTGKPGIIATWSWHLRAGACDTKLSASAHALETGQISYSSDAAPPGLVEYSAVTGKGASLAASFRLWLKHHAWLGAAWSQRPPGAPRVWITLGLRG